MRVVELAAELKVPTDALLTLLRGMGIPVADEKANVVETDVAKVRARIERERRAGKKDVGEAVMSAIEETQAGTRRRRRRRVADEPEELNGDNKGPDPFGFILAGLTSCVAITLRMYIQRKEMKVRRIAIEASMNEDKEIKLLLEVDADITEQEHKRLGQIAEMCPVHKFLKKEAVITKEMV